MKLHRHFSEITMDIFRRGFNMHLFSIILKQAGGGGGSIYYGIIF